MQIKEKEERGRKDVKYKVSVSILPNNRETSMAPMPLPLYIILHY